MHIEHIYDYHIYTEDFARAESHIDLFYDVTRPISDELLDAYEHFYGVNL